MSSNKPDLSSMRQAFADTIFDLASTDTNLYIVDVDLFPSLMLERFASRFKTRFVECGVSESNAAAVAAGLAHSGKKVFLTSFACFSPAINWAVIKQSICLNNLPVTIVGSHAGLLSGDLGATHQMLEDVSLMRTMPNMEVFAPIDSIECSKITRLLSKSTKPSYLRLVRPSTIKVFPSTASVSIGKSHVLSSGKDITILGYGPALSQVLDIDIKGIKPEIINCSSIKHLDQDTILKSVKKTHRCLVVEDHQKNGGLGESVAALILENNLRCRFAHLAVDNQFGQSATDPYDLYRLHGLSPVNIIETVKKLCSP